MGFNRHYTLCQWSCPSPRFAVEKTRRAIATSVAGIVAGLVVMVAAREPARPEGSVVIGVDRDAGALLPVIEQGFLDAEINQVLYLGLNSQRWEHGVLDYMVDELSLAEGWEYGHDSLTLTYQLRPEAVWSDGEPITSADVVFTYQLIRQPEIASSRVDCWENLDSVVAVDDRRVTFFFRRRYPGMLYHTGVGIIPAHIFREHATDNATLANHPTLIEPGSQLVVSGPFQVGEWRRGEQLVLVPNPRAFTASPGLERVVFRIIPDNTTRLIELEKGRVDVIDPMPIGAAQRLEADPRFRVETLPDRFYDYVVWNGARFEPFADTHVRLALSLAIDRQGILTGLEIAPYARVAAGPFPLILRKLADPTLYTDPYMPDLARAMLAAKGWRDRDGDGVLDRDGQEFRFTLLTSAGNERRTSAAEALMAHYAALGIDVHVEQVDSKEFLDTRIRTRDFEAVLMGWRIGLEPDYVVGLFWPPDRTFNITGYASATVDSLINLAQSAATEDEAASYWRAAAHEIADDHPYAFLWFFSGLVAVNERVRGTRINTYGAYHNLHQWKVEG